ncbi:MAG: IclR family transcriptional regulator [Chloroflexota bacterium]
MTTRKSSSNVHLTQSVMRALSILNCFTDQSPELRMTDISQRLGLTTSLVSRLLATLEHDGFVQQDPATGLYRLGNAVLTLAGVALNHDQLRTEALREMQEMSREIGLGVNLSVLDNGTIFYLAHVETPEIPRPYTLIGRRNPLHATGMGKMLLAHLPADEQDALINEMDLHAYTVHTHTDADELRAELSQIQARGWGVEMEELALSRACIAGPVKDASGTVVGAMSLSGPLSQFKWEQRQDELISAVIEICDRVSMRLGYITAPGMRPELNR